MGRGNCPKPGFTAQLHGPHRRPHTRNSSIARPPPPCLPAPPHPLEGRFLALGPQGLGFELTSRGAATRRSRSLAEL